MPVAKSLDDVEAAVSPQPLEKPEDLNEYYRNELNQLRGGDLIGRFEMALAKAYGGASYKAFLMGHTGVGKSTELSRLIQRVNKQYRPYRFKATTDLDPGNFEAFDVVLLMVSEVVRQTAEPVANGGAGQPPSDSALRDLWNWFAGEEVIHKESTKVAASGAAGAGIKENTWWAKIFGLFVTVKGEMKYASARETKTTEYRLKRLSPLITICNTLLQESNRLLREATGREWLIIGEEFDRQGIGPALIQKLFVDYGNVFKDLDANLICTIPAWLVNSDLAAQLPLGPERILRMPDTPVYDRRYRPDRAGRKAVQAVLEARVASKLFAPGQMQRLIVASGGNLRDLFALVTEAATLAQQRSGPKGVINKGDVATAINWLRNIYMSRLGESENDRRNQITYEKKAARLVDVYNQNPESLITDSITHSLLMSRAVLEFNHTRWFGVHPIVVDILRMQRRVRADKKGKVPGGVE
jgi:hypothetical protein